ncbi:MAG: tetratricopeptide repeat protein, partial [Anaerolineae bacterium]|nr:tetratricopeptide repeat protein [Anaerolineae bacterium]
MSEQDRLAQAVELVKAGKHAEAQEIVAEVIRADRNNARAWILMAKIVDDPEKALQCWQQVARLKPDDPRVQEEIARLKGEPATQTQSQERPFNAKSFVSAPKRWDNNPLPDGATSKCNRKTFCCL